MDHHSCNKIWEYPFGLLNGKTDFNLSVFVTCPCLLNSMPSNQIAEESKPLKKWGKYIMILLQLFHYLIYYH